MVRSGATASVRMTSATATMGESCKREAAPGASLPSRWAFVLGVRRFAAVVVGGEERVGGALVLEGGDKVPEGSCLIHVSYGWHDEVVCLDCFVFLTKW